jgi:hypothetical protein
MCDEWAREREAICSTWIEPWWCQWGGVVSTRNFGATCLEDERHKHGNNKVKCAKNLLKLWKLRHECMFLDSFAPSIMYSEELFKLWNRMDSKKIMKILQIVCDYDFNYCKDKIGQRRLACLQSQNA